MPRQLQKKFIGDQDGGKAVEPPGPSDTTQHILVCFSVSVSAGTYTHKHSHTNTHSLSNVINNFLNRVVKLQTSSS